MAHYAVINSDNIVEEVITAPLDGLEVKYSIAYKKPLKQCSYNTQGGIHVLGGTPFRKNYPGPGYTYDPVRDAFIPPKPDDNAILNEDTCLWELPQ